MSLVPVLNPDFDQIERRTEHAERIQNALRHSLSQNTLRSYASVIRQLRRWATTEKFDDWLNPAAIAAFLAERAETHSTSYLITTLAAVRHYALEHDLSVDPTQHPRLRQTLAGLRRIHAGEKSVRRVHAIRTDEVKRVLASIGDSATDRRDKALLALMFAGAFRRSEITSLRRSDLRIGSDGIVVTLRKSKTDQLGAGQTVGIARGHGVSDPVALLTKWLATRGKVASDEPVFCRVTRTGIPVPTAGLSGSSIARIIQARTAAAGLDQDYSGHSPRAGHATEAAARGLPLHRIQKTTRHRSLETLTIYLRETTVLETTTSGELGL